MLNASDAMIGNHEKAMKNITSYLDKTRAKLLEKQETLSNGISLLKQDRVQDQKKILDLQRRHGYAIEEFGQDKTKLLDAPNLWGIDLNNEEGMARSKIDDVMLKLKDKMGLSGEVDQEGSKFIQKLSLSGAVGASTQGIYIDQDKSKN
jgi:hypothetical protein